ncbi:MAG TPA: polysaccharide deacetylase family protein [Solirubrobacteraceae bacterium]|nr:polysaccharide deacetylase family protein [Solirubrobacteraceae bacterium]
MRRAGTAGRTIAASALLLALAGCGSAGSPGRGAAGPSGASPAGGAERPAGAGRAPGTVGAPTAGTQEATLSRLISLGLPVYCAGPRGDMVALTFDDGPGPYTPLALRKLAKHGVRGTFFLVGNVLSRGPGMPLRERRQGAVGDHSWTHPVLPALPAALMHDQLARTQTAVASASGGRVRLFRPPYGARNPAVDAQSKALGMLEVLWNIDSRDSLGANYAAIADNVRRGLRPGAIVLLHENRGQTIRALLAIFDELDRRHLRAVTVPELLAADPPSEAQVRRGPQGCPGISGAPRAHG